VRFFFIIQLTPPILPPHLLDEPPHLTMVTPFNYPPFRTIKLRPQRTSTCRACGDLAEMSEEVLKTKISSDLSTEDYISFCGLKKVAVDVSKNKQVDVSVSSKH
jgi:hypothetical protein